MNVINYIVQNASQLLSILSLCLGVGVAVAHLLNKNSVQTSLQNIQNTIASLQGSQSSNNASSNSSVPPSSSSK